MASAWLVAAVLVLAPAPLLQGQQAAPRFTRWEAPAGVSSDTLPVAHGDYRYEGLAFGGLVFGALGAYVGTRGFGGICPLEPGATCGDDGNKVGRAVALGLVGAAVGGGLGYLVGRFSPKRPRPELLAAAPQPLPGVPDSVRVRTGYQHWRGAGLGLAIGAGLGAVTGGILGTLSECSDCEQTSAGEGALIVGLLGAGAGGVVGFLAGLSSPKYAWVSRSSSAE